MFSALKDLAAKSRKPTAAAPVVVPTPPPPVAAAPQPSKVEEVIPASTTTTAVAESSHHVLVDAAAASSSSATTAVAEVASSPSPAGYLPTTIGRCLRWRVANVDALLLETSLRCAEIIANNDELRIQAALPPMLNIRANDSFGINALDDDDTSTPSSSPPSPKEPFNVAMVEAHTQSLLDGILGMMVVKSSSSTPTPLQSLLQELMAAFTDFRFIATKAQISVVDPKQRNYQSRLQQIRHEFVWSSVDNNNNITKNNNTTSSSLVHANARLLHAIESLLEMATSKLLVPSTSSSSLSSGDGGGGVAPTIATYRQLISATNSFSLRVLVSERTALIQEVLAYQTRIKALLPLLPILASSTGGKRPRDDDGGVEGRGGGVSMDVLAERHSIYRMPQSVVSTGNTLLSNNNTTTPSSPSSYHDLLNVLFFEGRRKLTSREQLSKISTEAGGINEGGGMGSDSNALKFPRLRTYMLDRPVNLGDVDKKKRNVDSSSSDSDDDVKGNKNSDSALTISKFFARCTAASNGDVRTALHKVSESHITSGWEPIFDAVSQAYADDSKGYTSTQYAALLEGSAAEGKDRTTRSSHLPHVLSLCADTPDGAITTALSAKFTTTATAKDADAQSPLPLPPKLSTCLIDIMDHVLKASSMLVGGGESGGGGVGAWKGRLTEVTHSLEDADNAYGHYAMGTDKWRSGISGGSVHMRRKLEKINKVHITHVMNNPVVKAAMLTVKTLVNDVALMVEEAKEAYQYTDAIQQ